MRLEEYYEKYYKSDEAAIGGAGKENKGVLPYDEWKNKCVYGCKICNKQFSLYNTIAKHLMDNHKLKVSEYKDQYKEILLQKYMYKCPKCQAEILWTTPNLLSHAEKKHNMSLKDFYLKYVKNEASVQRQKKNWTNKKRLENWGDSTWSTSRWSDRCEYQCKICQKNNREEISYKWMEFNTHLKNYHKMTSDKYKANHAEDLITKRWNFKCPICEEDMFWRERVLQRHALHHTMTVEQLREAYEKTEEEIKASKMADLNPTSSLGSHLLASALANEPIASTSTAAKVIPLRLKHSNVSGKTNSAPSTPPEQNACGAADSRDLTLQNFIDWKWVCEFKCQICGHVSRQDAALGRHITTHSITRNEYVSKYGPMRTKTSKHACKLCQNEIVQDGGNLVQHFTAAHPDITLSEYFNQHVASGSNNAMHEPTANSSNGAQEEDEADLVNKNTTQTNFTLTAQTSTDPFEGNFMDWKWGCEYECKICGHISRQYQSLVQHLKSHDITRNEYQSRYGPMRTKVTKHVCNLCHNEIIRESTSLSSHISTVHSINLEQYFNEYVAKVPNAARNELSINASNVEEKGAENWMNKNKYKCVLLDYYTSDSKREFLLHINLEHDMDSYEEFVQDHGDPETTMVRFTCQMCFEEMNFDEYDIKEHLEEKHEGISPNGYYHTYIAAESVVAPQAPQPETRHPLRKSMFDWNQCRYSCSACDKVFKCNSHIYKHVQRIHPERIGLHPSEKYTRTSAEHICKICNRGIQCERMNILQHLKTHKLNLSDYENQFTTILSAEFAGINAARSLNSSPPPANNAIDDDFDVNMGEYCNVKLQEEEDDLMTF